MLPLKQRTFCVGLVAFLLILPQAMASPCEALSSYREIINCVASQAPEIRHSDLEAGVAGAEIDQASQIRNPELESRNLWNTQKGAGTEFATETQLLFPIQLGGKRGARTSIAKSRKESALAYAQTTREKVLIETAQSLHRLRQLETELYLATEAIERFERIISAFRRRPQLNPEQSVSLTTFRYAAEEERQKRAQALAEQSAIEMELSLNIGRKIQAKKGLFPNSPEKWPAVKQEQIVESAELKLARAHNQEALALGELASAEAWPDLKIGPSYERMPDRDRTEERFGIGLAMELPLFNRNQGGRRAATLGREVANLEAEFADRKLKAKLENLILQYNLITKALATAPSQLELEKGHRAFEGQFNRGLVSYSLIIEAHRQLHDTVDTKHRQEITALNLLWSIYKLTGKLAPENL